MRRSGMILKKERPDVDWKESSETERERERERAAWWCHGSDVTCPHNEVAILVSVMLGFLCVRGWWIRLACMNHEATETIPRRKINVNEKTCSSQDVAVQIGREKLGDEFESFGLCLLSLSCQMTVSFSLTALSWCFSHSAALFLPPAASLPLTQSHFLGV